MQHQHLNWKGCKVTDSLQMFAVINSRKTLPSYASYIKLVCLSYGSCHWFQASSRSFLPKLLKAARGVLKQWKKDVTQRAQNLHGTNPYKSQVQLASWSNTKKNWTSKALHCTILPYVSRQGSQRLYLWLHSFPSCIHHRFQPCLSSFCMPGCQ